MLFLNVVSSFYLLENKFGARVQTYLFDFYDGDYAKMRKFIEDIDVGFVCKHFIYFYEFFKNFSTAIVKIVKTALFTSV